MAAQGCAWVGETLRADILALPSFLRSACATADTTGDISAKDEDRGIPLDPEKLKYIRGLIAAILEARKIAASYNPVVIVLILVIASLHWRRRQNDLSRWRKRLETAPTNADAEGPASSSSSSTIQGTLTPPDAAKPLDMERLPLLERKPARMGARSRFSSAISSWLVHQPPPLPLINRSLPSNGTSLFITCWLALNVFFHLYRLPLRWDYFFVFADRAGLIFVVNLPLLYLLAAKNQPLRRLTGYSYEALNIFHRRIGELMCLEAVIHFSSMVAWQYAIAPDWIKELTAPGEYWTHPIVLFGIGAFVSYELLYFTSLGSFRQRWYELFLASHAFLQAAALFFLYFHYPTSRLFVFLSLLIFLVDRFMWRFWLRRSRITTDLHVLEDGETFLVSADWNIPPLPSTRPWWKPSFLQRQSVVYGWEPTDHVFLTVPALGRSFDLQAHPFTIASAAPGILTKGADSQTPTHAWLSLLVRAHDGFTVELLRYAKTHERVPAVLDGPYGSSHALEMLRASGCVILVAGGSGIAVTFPLVWALLHDGEGRTTEAVSVDSGETKEAGHQQQVRMLWVTHSRSHQSWIPEQQLDELVARGLDLVIPEPTDEAGRPDVTGLVSGWIEDSSADGQAVGVVVSGPDGLNRSVRNVCAKAISAGADVRVAVEKFGW
ncbi:hypothetical protein QBC34DRAFT_392452 [Podospora aff. communis PSN243]|uniref:FAD-binding FR-type domain-containing protein n=1 Tax=Podospora aff. communis PSN243 TaxID=3040156 RepID=A0AAV9H222_9PEZI|nr:hypothetical protein QBC34DRAFT_392452 [Podospora aff. communis PSN243]